VPANEVSHVTCKPVYRSKPVAEIDPRTLSTAVVNNRIQKQINSQNSQKWSQNFDERPDKRRCHCYSARSYASAEYWIQFTAAFWRCSRVRLAYNSVESELIWTKSGARLSTLSRAGPAILGAIRAVAIAGEPGEILFFFVR